MTRKRASLILASTLLAAGVAASEPPAWPKDAAESFVAGCKQSMGNAARFFPHACECSLERVQRLVHIQELEAANEDPRLTQTLQKVVGDCLDADPAGYDEMLRVEEHTRCIAAGESPTGCACMTRHLKTRWPRPSLYMASVDPSTRKAEHRKWAEECRGEAERARKVGKSHVTTGEPPAALTAFLAGTRAKFDSAGHPKAQGIHLTLEYPARWVAAEGERPHVVQKMTGQDDSGLPVIAMLVIQDVLPGLELVADDLYSDESLKDIGESQGGTLIASGRTKLEGEPAAWMIVAAKLERAGITVETRAMTFIVIRDNSMIQLQCMVGGPPSARRLVSQRFDANVPLFRLIANSLVLQDKWK